MATLTSPPQTPEDAELIFRSIREEKDTGPKYSQTAGSVEKAVESKLQSRYGEQEPIDWYEIPEASVLAVGAAAAGRIAAYTSTDRPNVNERVKQWHLALKAYALCMHHDAGNILAQAVQEHGQYRDSITFMPAEC